ncbi:site-specific DNA-methyltransferase [Salinicoccus albus]|uniref:site-specific DNA-methyltransferase n=1 Tax=Salinicoccus albus TaxID=418756 RepID=UPI00037A1B0E|nr:site-specific DNA-methyltransferase [Salinicoccus albus]
METKLQQEINKVLKTFPEYWHEDTLLKNKLIEEIRLYNEKIIEALLSNELIRGTYSIQFQSGTIFKIEDFISMLRFKNYWDNSYTKYTNEIGLTSENKYLKYNTDVVLDFPHKDGILEGGMSREEIGKREIYYHNVIAKEEIDTLLSPKILQKVKKYNTDGEHRVTHINDTDNLILKGNNLIALHSLKERYESSVKLIYIDPPYNTGNDSFKYNDHFNRSTWLTFMKNRLSIAKELLTEDGSIYIQLDYNEVHYLKCLMDEIFGPENFQREIIWDMKTSSGYKTTSNNWVRTHDTILFYTKNKNFYFNKLYTDYPDKYKERFSKVDDEGRRYRDDRPGHKKQYLDELKGIPMGDVWGDIMSFQQASTSSELVGFSTQKPESLIKRIIESSTSEEDIVLDFVLGSGTTAAVAHKMNRQYIGIEQMNYVNEVSVPRLQKVIEGEQGGISKDVDWQGSGSFVYAELYSLNEEYLQAIQGCSSNEELEHIINQMKQSAYLNFKVDLEKVTTNNEDFKSLSLKEQKDVLIQVLDMNQLYLNYSEIEDSQYDISDSVKDFNHSFYQKEGDHDE